MKPTRRPKRSKDQSENVTDEVINTASHLAATVFALLGASALIVDASIQGDPWKIVGFSVYGASLICLFLFSTLHHGIHASPRTEDVLRHIDYSAIFFLIAGSFTPICLVVVRNGLGWSVFGVVWLVSMIGIALRASIPALPKWLAMTLYGTLGWVAAVLAVPLMKAAGFGAAFLLAAGGILYTVGGVMYLTERPNPIPGRFGFHEIWHLMVILGALSHYLVMYLYVRTF
jgi:hemolysin III